MGATMEKPRMVSRPELEEHLRAGGSMRVFAKAHDGMSVGYVNELVGLWGLHDLVSHPAGAAARAARLQRQQDADVAAAAAQRGTAVAPVLFSAMPGPGPGVSLEWALQAAALLTRSGR